jgi:hypothetical protein
MTVDAHFAYLLAADRMFSVPLTREGPPESAPVPLTAGRRVLAPFLEGAIAGWESAPQLLYITAALAVRPVATPYRGVTAIAPIDSRLICGVVGSGVPRMIAPDGREIRAFVGHTAPVGRVARLSDQMFASAAEDGTARAWDLRDRFPVLVVGTSETAVESATGSREYLIVGWQNRAVNVFDLRNPAGRPVLGIRNLDHVPVAMQYNQHEDTLAMFGAGENNGRRDSKMFRDRGGERKQKIFRVYRGFVGVDDR